MTLSKLIEETVEIQDELYRKVAEFRKDLSAEREDLWEELHEVLNDACRSTENAEDYLNDAFALVQGG